VESLPNAREKIIMIVLTGWFLYFTVRQEIFYGSISKGISLLQCENG